MTIVETLCNMPIPPIVSSLASMVSISYQINMNKIALFAGNNVTIFQNDEENSKAISRGPKTPPRSRE